MTAFKKTILQMLEKKGFIVSKDSANKSKFYITKSKTQITIKFSNEGTALLQYFTKTTNINLKDFFDNGNSDTEILKTLNDFFDTIANIQKIEAKISKKELEIIKLKEEILNMYNTGA